MPLSEASTSDRSDMNLDFESGKVYQNERVTISLVLAKSARTNRSDIAKQAKIIIRTRIVRQRLSFQTAAAVLPSVFQIFHMLFQKSEDESHKFAIFEYQIRAAIFGFWQLFVHPFVVFGERSHLLV